MDYSKLSDKELLALKAKKKAAAPDLSTLSDAELLELKRQRAAQSAPTPEPIPQAPKEIDPSLPSIGAPREIPAAPDQSSWWDKLKSAGSQAFDITPPGMMLKAGKAALPYAEPLLDISPVGMMAKQATRASDAVQALIGEGTKAATGQETDLKQKLSNIVTQGADYNLDKELGFNPIQLKNIRGIGPAITSLTGMEEVPALDYLIDPVDWASGALVNRGMRIAGKKAALKEKVATQLAPDPVNPAALEKSIARNLRKADELAVQSARRATKEGKLATLDELKYKKQTLAGLLENKKALDTEQNLLKTELDNLLTKEKKGTLPADGLEKISGINNRLKEIDVTLQGGELNPLMKSGKVKQTIDPVSGAIVRKDTYGSLNKIIDDTQTELSILRERANKAFDPSEVKLPSQDHAVLNPTTGKLNATSPLKINDVDVPANWVDDIYSEIDNELVASNKRAADSKGLLNAVRKAIRRKAYYINQPKKVLAAIGPEAEELAVRNTSYAYGRERIKNDALSMINGMRKKYNEDVMTEAMQSIAYETPTNKLAVMEAKKDLQAFYEKFAQAFEDSKATVKTRDGGIKEFTRIHNYVTQSIPKEERAKIAIKLMEANTDSEFVDELLKAGVIRSKEEGLNLYNKVYRNPLSEKRTGYQNERAFTPQQLKKLGIKQKWGYDVLDEYVRSSSDVIARNAAFGNKGQRIDAAYQAAISKAQAMGDTNAVKFLDNQKKEILEGVPKLTDFWNKFLKINTFQIGFGGPAANALQIAMPAVTTDMATTAKAWNRVKKAAEANPDAVARQLGLGLAPDDVNFKAYQLADKDYENFIYKAADKYAGEFLGIKKLDNFSRKLARATGAERVQMMFDALKTNPNKGKALKFFDQFGFGIDLDKALKRGYLTEQEILSSAQNFDNMINFNMISTDLPALFKSTFGRIMFQFQAPAYLQTILLKDTLLKEAMSGNFMPLIKYSIAATIAGEAQGTLNDINALRNPEGRENPGEYGRPNIRTEFAKRIAYDFNKTGFGIVSNWLDAAASGRKFSDIVLGVSGGYPKLIDRMGAALGKVDNSRYGGGKWSPDYNKTADALLSLPIGPRVMRTPIQSILRKFQDKDKKPRR